MSPPRRALDRPPPQPWKPVLALALAVLLGFTGYSTWSYWQDTAEVGSGQFTAGRLDLQLDDGGATGLGAGYSKTSISASGLFPGETLAYPLTVRNVSDARATYTATVQRGSTWGYDGSSLTFRLFAAGTPDASDTSYPRQQSCSGTGQAAQAPVPASPTTVTTGPRPLSAGGSEPVCLLVGLAQDAASGNQGQTGTITLTLTLTQEVG